MGTCRSPGALARAPQPPPPQACAGATRQCAAPGTPRRRRMQMHPRVREPQRRPRPACSPHGARRMRTRARTHDADGGVALHLLVHRLTQRLPHHDLLLGRAHHHAAARSAGCAEWGGRGQRWCAAGLHVARQRGARRRARAPRGAPARRRQRPDGGHPGAAIQGDVTNHRSRRSGRVRGRAQIPNAQCSTPARRSGPLIGVLAPPPQPIIGSRA